MGYDINILAVVAPIIYIAVGATIISYYFLAKSRRIGYEYKLKHFEDIESEKRKISREIHDSISEYTFPLKQYFRGERINSISTNEEWLGIIEKYERYLANLNETLYPSELLEGNIYGAIKHLAKVLESDTLLISVDIQTKVEIIKDHEIHIFRIIQESVTNAITNRILKSILIFITSKNENLIIRVIYTGNVKSSLSTWKKQMRGQKIIQERLSIVNGERKLILQDDWVVEEFKFKGIL